MTKVFEVNIQSDYWKQYIPELELAFLIFNTWKLPDQSVPDAILYLAAFKNAKGIVSPNIQLVSSSFSKSVFNPKINRNVPEGLRLDNMHHCSLKLEYLGSLLLSDIQLQHIY